MMKKKWRKDERGVSEVVGTILILAMTVVLFASIILWVSSIPTPAAQTRLDMFGQMEPIYAWRKNDTSKFLTLEGATRVTIHRELDRWAGIQPKGRE